MAPSEKAPPEVTPEGFWWGGWYFDRVDNTLLQNNSYRGMAEVFQMLGRGVCMDQSETTSLSGSINFTAGYKFTEAVSASLGFSASGTRTFATTYKYCGPSESSAYNYRYFYKQLIFNQYQSDVTRCYWWWNGLFKGCEAEITLEYVPYMAIYSEDSNQ